MLDWFETQIMRTLNMSKSFQTKLIYDNQTELFIYCALATNKFTEKGKEKKCLRANKHNIGFP